MRKRQPKVELKKKALHLAVASVFTVTPAWAAPTSPTVTHGNASFNQNGSTLTVTNTPGSIINWASFGINAGETVKFVQQSAASAVLNRVTGMNPSQILGTLQSNGRVFLINPRGILFGQGAVIDTAGFVASTLNMTDDDFLNGRMRFNADLMTPGRISNAGEIKTPNGGFVYLIAPDVENTGIINTPSGEAILAAGHHVELVDSGDPDLRVKVSASSQDVNLSQMMVNSGGNIFSVLNSGRVSANTAVAGAGGKIYFKSAGDIRTTATSVVEARGDTSKDGGYIQGFADGSGRYQGIFDISGKNGGFVETSGSYLDVNGISLKLDALDHSGSGGTWLLDPYNILITGAADNNIDIDDDEYTAIGSPSVINVVTLQTALNAGANVIVDTNDPVGPEAGNITLNTDIDVSAPGGTASLTFLADGQFFGNGKINNSGTKALSVYITADRNGTGNGGIEINKEINIRGDLNLTSNSGDILIRNNVTAATDSADAITINAFGNVKILGGSGLMESASLIAQSGFVDINFKSAGHQLVLEGGAGSGSTATISAGSVVNGVHISGIGDPEHPDVEIKSFSNSEAKIISPKIIINADDLLIQGTAAAKAKVQTPGASGEIDLYAKNNITISQALVTGNDGVDIYLNASNGKIELKNNSVVGTETGPLNLTKTTALINNNAGHLTTDASSLFRAAYVELFTNAGNIDVRAEAFSPLLGISAVSGSGNITLRALAPVYTINMSGGNNSEVVLIPEAGIGTGTTSITGSGKNMQISRPDGDLLFDGYAEESLIKFDQLDPDGALTIFGRKLEFGYVIIEADTNPGNLVLAATDRINFFNSFNMGYGGSAQFDNIDQLQAAAANSINISDTSIYADNYISMISRDIRLTDQAYLESEFVGLSATRDLSLENSFVVASDGGIAYLTGQTVTLSDQSYVTGGYIAVNYDPEALMAVDGIGDLSDLENNRSSSVVTISDGTFLYGAVAVGIKSGSLTVNAGYGGVAGISGGQFVDLMTTGNVTLNATAHDAIISAGNDVYMATGGQVILNSGLGSARIETSIPTTIYMDFPLLSDNGYLVDGIHDIVSAIDSSTGFFEQGMPAVLGGNMFVRYGGSTINVDRTVQQSVDQAQRRSDETYECS